MDGAPRSNCGPDSGTQNRGQVQAQKYAPPPRKFLCFRKPSLKQHKQTHVTQVLQWVRPQSIARHEWIDGPSCFVYEYRYLRTHSICYDWAYLIQIASQAIVNVNKTMRPQYKTYIYAGKTECTDSRWNFVLVAQDRPIRSRQNKRLTASRLGCKPIRRPQRHRNALTV